MKALCVRCGTEIDPVTTFCRGCPAQADAPGRSRRTWPSILALTCFFALGFWLGQRMSRPAEVHPGAGNSPVAAAPDCHRHLLKIDDVAGILSAPVIGIQPLPGDAQSCEFVTSSFPAIIVSVRPGLGRTTVDAWARGKMPLKGDPLPGVGDGALWVDALREVIAQKNAVLCDIQVRGGGSDLASNSRSLPGALGALCNRILAAY
jgi:hypothetical protein